MQLFVPLTVSTLLLFACIALGWRIACSLLPQSTYIELLPYIFPVGSGSLTFFMFLVSWIGVPLTRTSTAVLYIIIAMLLVWASSHIRRERILSSHPVPPAQGRFVRAPELVLFAFGVGLFVLMAYLAIGRSYSTWDAIAIWSVKGYGIALEGSVLGAGSWGAHNLSYPLNVPLLIAIFRIFQGDSLPGSKLLFPLFFSSLLLGCYLFWRRRHVDGWTASLAVIFLASIPVLFEHGTIGYANLPFTTYCLLAVLAGVEGILAGQKGMQTMSGLLFGLAIWTRPEAIFMVPLVMLAVYGAIRSVRPTRLSIVCWVLPAGGIAIMWVVFSMLIGSPGDTASSVLAAIRSIGQGDLHLGAFSTTLRSIGARVLQPSLWGWIVPMVLLIAFLHKQKLRAGSHPAAFALFTVGLILALSMLIFYYLVSFTGDLRVWLDTGVDRMFLPVGVCAFVWAVTLTGRSSVDI